jgi:hypothetical protein
MDCTPNPTLDSTIEPTAAIAVRSPHINEDTNMYTHHQSQLASNDTTIRPSKPRFAGVVSRVLSALALAGLVAGCSAAMGEEEGELLADSGGEESVGSSEEQVSPEGPP